MPNDQLIQKLIANQDVINNLVTQISAYAADQKQQDVQTKVDQSNQKQLDKLKHPLTINQIFTIIAGISSLITVVLNIIYILHK